MKIATTAHEEARATFEGAGFWLEDFLAVFMYTFPDGRTLTCAWDWEGCGKWAAQLTNEGTDLGGEDFDTPAQVIAYRDSLKA